MLSVLLAGCATSKPPQRYAWVTGLKTDQATHYEYLHAHVWPGVNETIKECHIQNFSIHGVQYKRPALSLCVPGIYRHEFRRQI